MVNLVNVIQTKMMEKNNKAMVTFQMVWKYQKSDQKLYIF